MIINVFQTVSERIKKYFRHFRFDREHLAPLFLILSAVGITVSTVLFKPPVWKVIPLYVSLFIALLSSRVNRLAPLIGALNSILYAAVYFFYGLYGMAAYALFLSSTLQFITFFRWKRNTYRNSVILKKMSVKMRLVLIAISAAAFFAAEMILSYFGSSYLLFDNLITLLGILLSIIYIFAYIEYYYIQVPYCIVTVALYVSMIPEHPEQWAYLCQSLYTFVCMVFGLIEARKLWKLQTGAATENK